MDELVDIVDEYDKVLYQEMKSVAHSKSLIHRTVHWVVLNKRKQILLTKRSFKKANWPWLYDASIWWHVQAQESYEKAVLREWREELGIKNGNYKYFGKFLTKHKQTRHVCSIFIIEYNNQIHLDKREFDSYIWLEYYKIMKINNTLFTPDYIETLTRIQNIFTGRRPFWFNI